MSKQSSAPSSDVGQQRLDPGQALLAQPVVADPLLPVHAHDAVAVQTHWLHPILMSVQTIADSIPPTLTPLNRSARVLQSIAT